MILQVSRRPTGTNYLVKVPDKKIRRGYDLVDVFMHGQWSHIHQERYQQPHLELSRYPHGERTSLGQNKR